MEDQNEQNGQTEIEEFLVELLYEKSDILEVELILTVEGGHKSYYKHIKPINNDLFN